MYHLNLITFSCGQEKFLAHYPCYIKSLYDSNKTSNCTINGLVFKLTVGALFKHLLTLTIQSSLTVSLETY